MNIKTVGMGHSYVTKKVTAHSKSRPQYLEKHSIQFAAKSGSKYMMKFSSLNVVILYSMHLTSY